MNHTSASGKSVVIVIPIYKESPSEDELSSFRQCLRILGVYDIALVTYEELVCDVYLNHAREFGKSLIRENFERFFFDSVSDYNRLCLSCEFYDRFRNYDYMFIYQLDGWVFRDELATWCSKNYDYVGAPWFKLSGDEFTYIFSGFVGNGGISLRRILFCRQVLTEKRHWPLLTLRGLWKSGDQGFWELCKLPLKLFGFHNNVAFFLSSIGSESEINEDMLFSFFKYSYRGYHIPDPTEAIKFSFEVHPSYLYKLNNDRLPFACHAYRHNEYDTFWKRMIGEND